MRNWTSGAVAMACAIGFIGCAVGSEQTDYSESASEETEALERRTEFQQEVDDYLKQYGDEGAACQDGRCMSVDTKYAIQVGDDHRVGMPLNLCAENKDGSLSSCTDPGVKFECPPDIPLCSCQGLFDCFGMLVAGACKGGSWQCTWVNGQPYCTCLAAMEAPEEVKQSN